MESIRLALVGLEQSELSRSITETFKPIELVRASSVEELSRLESVDLIVGPYSKLESYSAKNTQQLFALSEAMTADELRVLISSGRFRDVFQAPSCMEEITAKVAWNAELLYRSRLGFEVLSRNLEIRRGPARVQVTPKEMKIFRSLAGAPEYRRTKNDITHEVWGNSEPGAKTLDVHLFNLRRKLKPLKLRIKFCQPVAFQIVVDPFTGLGDFSSANYSEEKESGVETPSES